MKTKISKDLKETIQSRFTVDGFQAVYKQKPKNFKVEPFEPLGSYVARPNGLNYLSGKQRLYIVGVEITIDDYVELISKKLKQKNLKTLPNYIR